MSDAASLPPRRPGPQSASQLSENIGDVLASIRQLIAQDEAGAPAAVPETVVELRTPRSDATATRRREILAQAQALNRRSDEAFGKGIAMAEIAPLRLGGEPLDPARSSAWSPGAAVFTPLAEGGPLVLGVPSVSAVGGVGPAAVDPISDTAGSAAADDVIRLDIPATPTPTAKAPDMPQTAAISETPAGPTALEQARNLAARAPEPALSVVEAALDTGGDAAAASIFSEMIRDVVRSELRDSGMTRDLRAMVLREVAQVLTQGSRAR